MKKVCTTVLIWVVILGLVSTVNAQTIVTDVLPQYVDGTDAVNTTPFAIHVTISGWTDCANGNAYLKGHKTGSTKVFRHWNGTEWSITTSWVDQKIIHIDENGDWSGWYYAKYHGFIAFKVRAAKATNTYKYVTSEEYSLANLLDMSTDGSWICGYGNPPAGRIIVALDGSDNVLGTWIAENNGINDNFPTAANYPSSPTSGFWEISVPAATDIAKLQVRNADNSVYAEDTSGWNSGSAGSSHELTDVSLPITLSSFSAGYSNGTIILRWSTESEIEIQGFNILRSEKKEGPFAQITTALIQAQGNSSAGKQYEFIDRNVEGGKGYWYKIEVVNTNGKNHLLGPVYAKVEKESTLPDECRLFCNYPNPFNPNTTIKYRVSKEASLIPISLKIYNSLGGKILTLVNGIQNPGEYSVDWNGRDSNGVEVPSGIYFYQLSLGDKVIATKKMLKVK